MALCNSHSKLIFIVLDVSKLHARFMLLELTCVGFPKQTFLAIGLN